MTPRRGGHWTQPTDLIRGLFESFRVHTPTGWGTGTLIPHDGGAPIPIKGIIVGGRPGDSVEMEGHWQDHPRYGRQFNVTGCVASMPLDSAAVIAWMASNFPGVGRVRAAALLDHFGGASALWAVIETQPERLAEVAGITADNAQEIRAAYDDVASSRDGMIVLRGWGLTDKQVAKCMDEWRSVANTVAQIRSNPYALCRHVAGFGFKRADEVARRVGVAADSLERMCAGATHTLEQAIQDGHCYLWGGQLQRMAADLLGVDAPAAGRGIAEAWRRGHIVRRGKRVYAPELEAAEDACADTIARLASAGHAHATTTASTEAPHVYH